MGVADTTRAMVAGAVLRPLAILIGGTFAVHRLARRLDDESSPTDYGDAIREALPPSTAVVDAMGASLRLAAPAVFVGLLIGLVTMVIARSWAAVRPGQGGAGLVAGLVLALAVPGMAWLPVERALDRPLLVDDGSLSTTDTARWALLIGLAVAPALALVTAGRRPWATSAAGTAGSEALVTRAGRRLLVGLPVLTFGLAMATAEVATANGGLFDRFHRSVAAGETAELVALAAPVIAVGAALALATDLVIWWARRRPPLVPLAPGPRPRPSGRRRVAAVALLAVAAVTALAIGGTLGRTDPALDAIALAEPRFGGPWLGTDADGRSLLADGGAALAMSLAGAAVPALVATLVGSGLATFRRALGRTGREALGALVDLLSWPPSLVVPLAAVGVAGVDRPLLDPIVLQVTGLLLVPPATRLLTLPSPSWPARLARHGAAAGILTALALAMQLLAGVLIAGADTADPDLGALIGRGIGSAAESPWPLAVPVGLSVLAAAALYWLVDMLVAAERVAATALASPELDLRFGAADDDPTGDLMATELAETSLDDIPDEGGADDPPGGEGPADDGPNHHGPYHDDPADEPDREPLPARAEDGTTEEAGPTAEPPDDTDDTDDDATDDTDSTDAVADAGTGRVETPEDGEPDGYDDQVGPAAVDDDPIDIAEDDEDPRPRVILLDDEPPARVAADPDNPATVGLLDDDRPDRDGDDVRDVVTVSSAVDVPGPDDPDGPDELDLDPDVLDDATSTVELRPADLRRAGLLPPTED